MRPSRGRALERSPGEGGGGKPFSEEKVWKQAHGEWRRIYGHYDTQGISMEWHEFSLARDLSIAESLHPGSLELCLNLEGTLEIPDQSSTLRPRQSAWFAAIPKWNAHRVAGQRHLFVTIEIHPSWLKNFLETEEQDSIHPELRDFLEGKKQDGLLRTGPLQRKTEHLLRTMETAGPPGPARRLWLQSRLCEILACELFPPSRAKENIPRAERTGRQLADKTRAILAENLENPPSLQEIARQVGCSPFHLSRIFTRTTGQTITRYLRQLRLERAAELLESGRFNVTETAMEVGYNSLSHFSKAFAEHFGHCPCRLNLNASSSEKPRPSKPDPV